jgi:hypothetical protein
MSGEQLAADIYMGPTYYMRLKHMVKDKINYRARGPNTVLTRQPVQGRANDGGLRIGEMERDGVLAHGMSYFLNESFMVRGEKEEYFIAICNKTGAIAIYNEAQNLFLSPYADGPIKFNTNPDGSQSIMNLSRFGRSFSVLRVPYAFKLLMQELQIMNVQMHIITEENVDQLLSMSFSNNINKLMKSDEDAAVVVKEINMNIEKRLKEVSRAPVNIPEPVLELETPPTAPASAPGSPVIIVPTAPQPAPGSSTPYNPNTSSTPYNPNTPDSLGTAPTAPQTNLNTPPTAPGTSESVPIAPVTQVTPPPAPESSTDSSILAVKPPAPAPESSTDSSILEVKPPPPPPPAEATEEKKVEEATKKIIL